MKTVLGFDYGTYKIGVAVGQRLTGSATPLVTLTAVNQKPDWRAIGQLIDRWDPDTLVVGLPYDMDDTEAEVAAAARRFARQLAGRFGRRVSLVDERLTSKEAEQLAGARRRKPDHIDAIAAKLILETWLSEQD